MTTKPRDEEIARSTLREVFRYEGGALYWRTTGRGRGDITKPAGCFNKSTGRHVIGIGGKLFLRSRLVWIGHNGPIPEGMQIDHINRNPKDDRIENLRAVTHRQNQQNRSNQSEYGVGVSRLPEGYADGSPRYQAIMRIRGKVKSLGCFRDPAKAREAYARAAYALGDDLLTTEKETA